MTSVERTEHHFGSFGRTILGQFPAAPSSPGPFVLLLKRDATPAEVAAPSPKLPADAAGLGVLHLADALPTAWGSNLLNEPLRCTKSCDVAREPQNLK